MGVVTALDECNEMLKVRKKRPEQRQRLSLGLVFNLLASFGINVLINLDKLRPDKLQWIFSAVFIVGV